MGYRVKPVRLTNRKKKRRYIENAGPGDLVNQRFWGPSKPAWEQTARARDGIGGVAVPAAPILCPPPHCERSRALRKMLGINSASANPVWVTTGGHQPRVPGLTVVRPMRVL